MITASLLLIIFLFIYYFSKRHTEHEFYQRLKERATLAAQLFLDKDEMNVAIYEEIRKKHLRTLPNEHEYIIPIDHKLLSSEHLTGSFGTFFFGQLIKDLSKVNDSLASFPPSFFREIVEEKYVEAKKFKTQYVGISYVDDTGDFLIIISATDKYGIAQLEYLRNILFFIYVISLGLIYMVGFYYSKQVLKPISGITKKANKIRASNLHLRLEMSKNNDELAELATTFNSMLDRLETSFEIQTNFVSNASHELKNPLTAILGETEIALERSRSEIEYVHALRKIEKEANRLDILVNSLLNLAQTDNDYGGLIIETIRIDELLIDLKSTIDQINPDNKITFDFKELPEQQDFLIARGNLSLLKMVLTNLIDNACKFSNNNKVVIKISATNKDISIEIRDTGIGIPSNEMESITEPFYRASNARGFKGSGIGLPLAKKIIKIHGGHLTYHSTEGTGTVMSLTLPNASKNISIAR